MPHQLIDAVAGFVKTLAISVVILVVNAVITGFQMAVFELVGHAFTNVGGCFRKIRVIILFLEDV